MIVHPVILSGGDGERLWPLSRKLKPKQFVDFFGDGETLFKKTIDRVSDSSLFSPPIVTSNKEHYFFVREYVEEKCIISEPEKKNTAPALTLAALTLDPDDIMLVMPSDHIIKNNDAFIQSIKEGMLLAKQDKIVTFGVSPTSPHTGYGYIESGIDGSVKSFIEKPSLEKAKEFMKSHLWNSGIFMMKSGVWIENIKKFEPEILKGCVINNGKVDSEKFSRIKNISIDYAVMEKASEVHCVKLGTGWNDLGSWDSIHENSQQDENGNSVSGDVILEDCSNCHIVGNDNIVVGIGLKDLVVTSIKDATLVAHLKDSQKVKNIVEQLRQSKRTEHISHTKTIRPWGTFEEICISKKFKVKRIVVKPHAALSLQMHHHRAEHWVVVCGTAKVTRNEETFFITEDQSTYINIGEKHRLENPNDTNLELIEVQTGKYLGEDDIVRFKDNYDRE